MPSSQGQSALRRPHPVSDDATQPARTPPVPHGFTSVGLVALDDERLREQVTEFVQDAPGLTAPSDPAAVDALVAADGAVTPALVRAVIGLHGWDAEAAAAAARRFRPS